MLEEVEKKGIGDFLSPEEDLEQREDLITESSNKTIGSYSFETDNLNVIVGYAKDSSVLELSCVRVKVSK